MELKKTTILSAFVALAGILAEIIFRDILSKSFFGVALSVLLAVVIIVAFYFAIDGLYYLENQRRDEEKKQQKEYEQRVYGVLNEQLKFQKAIYSEVKNLQQQLAELSGQMPEQLPVMHEQEIPMQIQTEPGVTSEDLEKVVSEINNHTMQAAKIVAKYVGKSTEELKEEIRTK